MIVDPRTTLLQSLEAILSAELADNACWEALIALAQEAGEDALVTQFERALLTEQEHLTKVQTWVELASLPPVIRRTGKLPVSATIRSPAEVNKSPIWPRKRASLPAPSSKPSGRSSWPAIVETVCWASLAIRRTRWYGASRSRA